MVAKTVESESKNTTEPLINRDLIRSWLSWGLVWLTVFPLVGLLVSLKFNFPNFLGETSWLTFGRLRPVHVNGVIFGAFSTPLIGLLYYMVPRLCGRRMAGERYGWWALAGWNLFLVTGSISLMMGYNLGFEADEFQWPFNILRYLVLAVVGIQVFTTIFRRQEKGFYVAMWYTTAALVWTLLNLILGNVILPYVSMDGISNAALHGLFIHYVVGLWITPAGLGLMYYFIPLSIKNPLFSHRLSLLGFWVIAFFYPFVGLHHYLFSPIPFSNQTISIMTSMMLIIPVWAVVTNLFGTAKGRWGEIIGGTTADHYAAKFLLLATLYYLLGCFQGSTEALRRMQELTHFTDFVIGHSHLTVFGTFIIAVIGAMYYVWPRVTGRELYSAKLASWHIWLFISGATVMFLGLAVQGFIQGSMLEHGTNFLTTVNEMKPWWMARTLAGATMDLALILMVINFYRTARYGKPFKEAGLVDNRRLETRPAGEEVGGLIRPSGVLIVAGMGFFATAVIVQGVVPAMTLDVAKPTVTDIASGAKVRAIDYTSEQKRGRKVYIREGCWYCHSQYIRSVTGETRRWGPLSQVGEYAFDQPELLSTRRIGPDLTRVGRKYADGWHAAHYWNARLVKPDSIMPRFPWLFKTGKDGRPHLNADGKALVAYVQSLGTRIGDWRETFAPTRLTGGEATEMSPADKKSLLALGKQVYHSRCIGCHGVKGDGHGPVAKFLKVKPRDFTSGIFKFHSTPGSNALPTDQDLFIIISHGLWGTAMPPWYNLPAEQRLAVIQYIKTFSDRWQKKQVETPIKVVREPNVTMASIRHGHKLFESNCAVCHGKQGHGDGIAATGMKDMWGHDESPANYTLPAGVPGGVKLGHDGQHIFKTVSDGIGGTPMPAFGSSLSPQQIWDIAHFVQSLRIDTHMRTLRQKGLKEAAAPKADKNLWQDISDAAYQGRIGTAVLDKGWDSSTHLAAADANTGQ